MARTKEVLCLSGGLDSVIAHYYLKEKLGYAVDTIYFDYGGYCSDEIPVVKGMFPNTIIDSDLTLSKWNESDPNAYVPYRNLMFAAKAASYGYEIVFMAGVKDDVVEDKSPEAFKLMSCALSKLGKKLVDVKSPFWDMTKAQIVEWFLKDSEVKSIARRILHESLSCYAPINGEACLCCPSCFRKWNALWENGIQSNFLNEDMMRLYYKKAMNEEYIEERNVSIIKCIDEKMGNNWGNLLSDYKLPIYTVEEATHLRYCIDIDGVLTEETEGYGDTVYARRTANNARCDAIAELYRTGNIIILHTARHQEDLHVTQKWLKEHSVPYHQLIFGKPKADIYIDDKMVPMEEL